MEGWNKHVNDAREEHVAEGYHFSDQSHSTTTDELDFEDQTDKSDTEHVNRDAQPEANDEQQCRICLGGVEDEDELGVSYSCRSKCD